MFHVSNEGKLKYKHKFISASTERAEDKGEFNQKRAQGEMNGRVESERFVGKYVFQLFPFLSSFLFFPQWNAIFLVTSLFYRGRKKEETWNRNETFIIKTNIDCWGAQRELQLCDHFNSLLPTRIAITFYKPLIQFYKVLDCSSRKTCTALIASSSSIVVIWPEGVHGFVVIKHFLALALKVS